MTEKENKPLIHISIDARGNIVLETRGTTGRQCDLLAGALEANLGEVTAREDKETYGEAGDDG